ncbi:40S ribosomal protein S12 [Musa troglodytarum]|uniref:40S ribosomal protein S12 n=1 Tax=Musa troglodytarum TaxID=320322 RepID=A0A9E7JW61_9LILI|nr:40S ribosomal protein S12 [Musa troglodytarum]
MEIGFSTEWYISGSWAFGRFLRPKTLIIELVRRREPLDPFFPLVFPDLIASDILQRWSVASRSLSFDPSEYNGRFAILEDIAAESSAPVLGEPMDLMTALQLVMKKSLAHDGLVRGLHEAAKAIEKHAAQLCILAEDCNQADYVKLVKALCADHNVHLVTVPSAKTLGEWAGLCKIDSEGKARKVVGCSCVVVKDYGEESEGLHIVQEYVKSH